MTRNVKRVVVLLVLAGVVGYGSVASALVVVNDTFDVGVTPFDDAGDPLDVNWQPISNDQSQIAVNTQAGAPGDPAIVIGSGNVVDATKNGAWGGLRAVLPTTTDLTLAVNERATITFNLALFDFPGGSATGDGNSSGFRWGLFNAAGYGAYANTGVSDTPGSSNTGLKIRQDHVPSVDDLMAGASLRDFEGANDVTTAPGMPSSLSTGVAYEATFIAERIAADRMLFTAMINGGTATTLDVDDAGDAGDNLFDFSGGYFVLRNGNNQSDIRLDNFMVEVTEIPEPATMLLMGLGGLVALKRRRA